MQQSSLMPSKVIISSGVILVSLIKGTVNLIKESLKLFLKTTESFRTKLLASNAN